MSDDRAPVVVARAHSVAEADFLKSVLAAHEIDAASSAAETAYPSVDFVQGLSITVAADQAEEARRVLTDLDEAETPPGPPDTDGPPG
jgi:hypothetical protein